MATGDVGRFDEAGRLFVEGRDDDMIVSGGENVFPQEVEDLLSRHEAVADVAAIGVEDDEFGQRLRAFVVRKAPTSKTDDAMAEDELTDVLKEHVGANLARYKVPRDFVYVAELPRNATGKILKRDLADLPMRSDDPRDRPGPHLTSPSRTSTARTMSLSDVSVAGRTW